MALRAIIQDNTRIIAIITYPIPGKVLILFSGREGVTFTVPIPKNDIDPRSRKSRILKERVRNSLVSEIKMEKAIILEISPVIKM